MSEIDQLELEILELKDRLQDVESRLCAWCTEDWGENKNIYVDEHGSQFKLVTDQAKCSGDSGYNNAVFISESTGEYWIETSLIFHKKFKVKL